MKHIIRTYCARHDLTLTDFATGVGVSLVTVYKWIEGSRIPNAVHLKAIKHCTGGEITPNDFFKS